MSKIQTEVSAGELLDKLSILEIKLNNINPMIRMPIFDMLDFLFTTQSQFC